MGFSDWLWTETGRRHGISLKAMAEFLWQHLTGIGVGTDLIIEALSKDFVGAGRQDLPEFLANQGLSIKGEKISSIKLPVKRQGRHLKAVAE